MSLAPGTRLGAYEVLALLGAGGMGEVYKARDPRLNRLIAIKLLPAAAATDAERRDRFEREAQAIAALNHPNIVTIHSVEEADGLFFLTMELVEGRSLAEVLPQGGLSLDRLLKIAIPVADAIAAAHQKGITHRDLKPSNIMLGEGEHDGRVKVLDFGLAKLADVSLAAAGPTALPTAPITGEGRILGTVAYMSPEQAEGKLIDARSDLFSLGVMLYEMATGRRPFTGATTISIISSILKDTPKSVTDLNPVLPRDLGRIVHRALAKDPERRYQSAKDLRNDLEELKASLDSGELAALAPGSGAVQRGRSARVWQGVVATLMVALGLTGWIYALMERRAKSVAPAATAPTIENLQITQLTTSGNAERPAISPDGKFVAYIQREGNDSSLWIRQTTTASNVQIVPSEPGVFMMAPTVMPDGGFVDFARVDGRDPRRTGHFELWRVPFLGGSSRRLVDNVWSPVGWSPDGRRLAFVRTDLATGSDALVIADADGSGERVLATRRRPRRFYSFSLTFRPMIRPAWSIDGRLIAVVGGGVQAGVETPEVVFVDVATGTERAITIGISDNTQVHGLAWGDPLSLILNHATDPSAPPQLWRMSYPDGRLSRLTNDVNRYVGVSVTADRSSLVTARSETRVGIWLADASARSATETVPSVPVQLSHAPVAWATDRLVYVTSVAGRLAIMSLGAERGGTAQEIVSNANALDVTADVRTVVFNSVAPGGGAGIWKIDIDGRQPVQIASNAAGSPVVTPDDRQVIFLSNRNGLQTPWIVSIDGGTPREVVNAFAGAEELSVSRDGKALVFGSTGNQVIVCDLPACVARRSMTIRASPAGGLRWTPDGRGIAYVDVETQMNIWVQPLDGIVHQLTQFSDGRRVVGFAWSRDGQRLAISRAAVTNDIVLFKGLAPR